MTWHPANASLDAGIDREPTTLQGRYVGPRVPRFRRVERQRSMDVVRALTVVFLLASRRPPTPSKPQFAERLPV
ncbi:MAG: hypothetical protein JWM95_383 [Gemmatimonadetes bacterium]|nr:hypothetical protein [Gemmatimonadota bacterium]